uniref:CSON000696 protein n=1 Tax=Culicoides sonorensis TaxID=179676 RepID=A0A336MJ11_CULSO
MKNQPCPKSDCMYLHELGDEEASFTKEEMHQGKHQEYEKKLHDTLIAQTQNEDLKNLTNNKQNKQTKRTKETWPSLTISPGPKATLKQVNTKETTKAEFKNKNDRSKNEKNKIYFEDEEVPNDADYIWSNVTDEGHEKALFDAPKLEETNFLSKEDTYLNDANVLQSKFCTAEKQEDIPSEESALKNRLSTKLPDLLNGTEIDRYYFNTSGEREIASNKIEPQPDWEDSLRHLMSKSNADDCTKQLRKSDELFAFNNLTLNDILMDNRNALFSDQYQPTNELKHNCTSNMLKFFDFHKNLQNQHNFQKGNMGAAEHSYSLMNEGLKSDSNTCRPTNFQQEAQFSVNKSTPKNTYVGSVYHLQNASVADELGFDPFVETQKALAELMRDELTRKTLEDPDNTKKRFSTVHAPPGFNTVNNCKINSWSNNSHPQNGQNILNTSKSSGVTNYKDWTCLDPAIVSFRQFPNYGPLPENTDARQHFQPFTDNFMQYSSLGGNSSFGLDQSQYGLNGIRNVQTQMTSNTLNWFSHNQSNFQPNSISYPPGFHSSLNGNKMN